MVFGIGILFIGLFLGIIGFAIDPLMTTDAAFRALMPVSQEYIDTMHNLNLMFKSCAILIPIGLGISFWANSTRTTPGEV